MVATIPIAKEKTMSVSNYVKTYSFTLVTCKGEVVTFNSDYLWTVDCYTSSNHHGAIQDAYSEAWAQSVRTGKTEMYSLTAIHKATGRVVHDATQHVRA